MNESAPKPETAPLIDWVLRQFPDTPKTRAKQWIVGGRFAVNGRIIRKPHEQMADPGDALELAGKRASTLECGSGLRIHPRVSLLYLDGAVAIVNKGPGLISVPSGNGEISALSIVGDFLSGKLKAPDRTVANRLIPQSYRNIEPLPVHRLDQYTSGVFCLACNPLARRKLIDQLQTPAMKREYIAYVAGKSPTTRGTWRHWVTLSPDELRQFIVPESKDAMEAITHFEVMREFSHPTAGIVSKLRLRLETGRKHQIRAQAAYVGLPLIGDRAYNPNYNGPDSRPGTIPFDRQALHAEVLTLTHPDTGKPTSWIAPLPKDLHQLETELTSKRASSNARNPTAPLPDGGE